MFETLEWLHPVAALDVKPLPHVAAAAPPHSGVGSFTVSRRPLFCGCVVNTPARYHAPQEVANRRVPLEVHDSVKHDRRGILSMARYDGGVTAHTAGGNAGRARLNPSGGWLAV